MPSLPDTAVCLHCGYSLRGLPEDVCPECGMAFDPDDTSTWRDASKPEPSFLQTDISPWLFGWPGPPSSPALTIIATACASAVTVDSSLRYYFYPSNEPNLLRAAFCLASIYLLIKFMSNMRARQERNTSAPRSRETPHRARWIALLAGVAILGLSYSNHLGIVELRLHLSRNALDAKAAAVRTSGRADNTPQWVGFLYFDRIGLLSDGTVKFELRRAGREGTIALTHNPNHPQVNEIDWHHRGHMQWTTW
jgi:hypothetical protein